MGDLLRPARISPSRPYRWTPVPAAATVARHCGIHPETVRRHRRRGTEVVVERPEWRVYFPEVLVDAAHPDHPAWMSPALRATVLGVCKWADRHRFTPEGSWWHPYAASSVGMATTTFQRHMARLVDQGALSHESGRIKVTPPPVTSDSPEQLSLDLHDDHRLRTDPHRSGALGAQCRWDSGRGTTHRPSPIRRDSSLSEIQKGLCASAHSPRRRKVETTEREVLETMMSWDRWRGPPPEVLRVWARACGWAAAEEAALTIDHRMATRGLAPRNPNSYGRALAERFRDVEQRLSARGRRRDQDGEAGRYREARRAWWDTGS